MRQIVATPEGSKLVVEVDGIGDVPAVADEDPGHFAVGGSVGLQLRRHAVTAI